MLIIKYYIEVYKKSNKKKFSGIVGNKIKSVLKNMKSTLCKMHGSFELH